MLGSSLVYSKFPAVVETVVSPNQACSCPLSNILGEDRVVHGGMVLGFFRYRTAIGRILLKRLGWQYLDST